MEMGKEKEKEAFFIRTLENIRRQAVSQGGCISRKDLEEKLESLAFSPEQMAMVEAYLVQHHIGLDQPLEEEQELTGEEGSCIQFYLEELKQLHTAYSKEEEEQLFRAAMEGEPEAENRLVEWYLPRVTEIARLYEGQGVTLEDLIGEGNLALASGRGMLCCLEAPQEVPEMLTKLVMGAMEDAIEERGQDAAREQKLLELVDRVAEQAKLLAEELQRKVTVPELAEESGLSPEEILEAIRVSGNQIEYMETGV